MTNVTQIADLLYENWLNGVPYTRLTGDLGPSGIEQAYEVQAVLQKLMLQKRGPIAGRKIALSSKAMQQMVNLDNPVAGAIFERDIHASPASVALTDFQHLGLEYELAFEIGEGQILRLSRLGGLHQERLFGEGAELLR